MDNIALCNLCNECGFLKKGIKNTLKPELGLFKVIEEQQLFPCHLHLKAITNSENTGIEKYVNKVNKVKICYGYVASLHKSNIKPKHTVMRYLYSLLEVESKDYKNVMTLDETLKYHNLKDKK
jgi:hypothetical protein